MCIVCIQANYEDGCFSSFQGAVLKNGFQRTLDKNKQTKTQHQKPATQKPQKTSY